ncbi:hypothetical protein RFI_11618 [Reticulomyxa filosa]|uniref:Uncharacterized protein n=1 Tax=Reticulomyxa filosa TaxID=46433 RepID=X6NIH6_RETFI|nr:hypothetical protein RFI_11618 [Reticulomyxa filosa]|eukprot:ETO25519.1 hypothetical protein RFI_11618 [Reticulomyxa filosa]
MEEDQEQEGLPDWLVNMNQLVLAIHEVKLTFLSEYMCNATGTCWDNVVKVDSTGPDSFYLVNGKYQPTICMNSGEWLRLRFISVIMTREISFNVTKGTSGDKCTLQLLAKDGIWLNGKSGTSPRTVGGIYLPSAGRADVAFYCPGAKSGKNTYQFHFHFFFFFVSPQKSFLFNLRFIFYLYYLTLFFFRLFRIRDPANTVVATIVVSGTPTQPNPATLTPFRAIRPSYIRTDLLNYTGSFQQYNGLNYWNIAVGFNSINSISFVNETDYLATISVDTVNEWVITNVPGTLRQKTKTKKKKSTNIFKNCAFFFSKKKKKYGYTYK